MHRPYKNHGVPCRKLARKHGFCCSGHKAESQRPVQRLLAIMMRNESYWAWDDVLAYFAHHPELSRRQFQTAGAWILTAEDPPAIVRLFESAVSALGLSCLGKSGSLPCACK